MQVYMVLQKVWMGSSSKASSLVHRMLQQVAKDMNYSLVLTDIGTDRVLAYFKLWVKARRAVLIAPYPSTFTPVLYPGRKAKLERMLKLIELFLWKRMLEKNYGILYIYDDPIGQNLDVAKNNILERESKSFEKEFLDLFDVLLVLGEEHERKLETLYGLHKQYEHCNFTELRSGFNLRKTATNREWTIGYVSGLLDRCSWLLKCEGLFKRMIVYGTVEKLKEGFETKGITHVETLPQGRLITSLNRDCDFGLVYYHEDAQRYFNRFSTAKLATYLLAGIPIIYPADYRHISWLNERYKIGIEIADLGELQRALDSVKLEKYAQLSENCYRVGKQISAANFTKKAFERALMKLTSDN